MTSVALRKALFFLRSHGELQLITWIFYDSNPGLHNNADWSFSQNIACIAQLPLAR